MSWSDAELDDRIEEIIVDAYGDGQQLSAFACALVELLTRRPAPPSRASPWS